MYFKTLTPQWLFKHSQPCECNVPLFPRSSNMTASWMREVNVRVISLKTADDWSISWCRLVLVPASAPAVFLRCMRSNSSSQWRCGVTIYSSVTLTSRWIQTAAAWAWEFCRPHGTSSSDTEEGQTPPQDSESVQCKKAYKDLSLWNGNLSNTHTYIFVKWWFYLLLL